MSQGAPGVIVPLGCNRRKQVQLEIRGSDGSRAQMAMGAYMQLGGWYRSFSDSELEGRCVQEKVVMV